METFIIRALQLILSLSILVLLHELGHFSFARLFNVRVDKFYMFFNPNFSLIRAKKINGKWQFKFFSKNVPANERVKLDADGDQMINAKGKPVLEPIPMNELPDNDWRKYPESTEWGIGWLPLGGYCKISGMIDESMDTTMMSQAPQPWEYRSRSVWQRLPIIVGGVLVNFILAMVIYSAVLFTWGTEYVPLKNAKYGLHFSKILVEAGFKNGDNIIKVDGKEVDNQGDVLNEMLFKSAKVITVTRDSQVIDVQIPADITKKVIAAETPDVVSIRFPFVIDEVKGSPASDAGLQSGDSIVGVNGKSINIFQEVATELDFCKNKSIDLAYVRHGVLNHTKVNLGDNGKMNVAVRTYLNYLQSKHTEYGFWASIPAGIKIGWETLVNYVRQFKYVFSKEGAKQMGGFGSIGKMFPRSWDWQIFWSMTALLSVILAFMNFLPIPGLDGGYVLFLLYEMITGKKPSDKFLEYAQTVGLFLLFALILYSNGNDIYKAIFK